MKPWFLLGLVACGGGIQTHFEALGPAQWDCALPLVAPAIAADTGWDPGTIQAAMEPADVTVKPTRGWYAPDGTWVVGLSGNDGTIWVGSDLHALAHEFRHVVADRLTGDPQGTHPGWTEAFEVNYRARLAQECQL